MYACGKQHQVHNGWQQVLASEKYDNSALMTACTVCLDACFADTDTWAEGLTCTGKAMLGQVGIPRFAMVSPAVWGGACNGSA